VLAKATEWDVNKAKQWYATPESERAAFGLFAPYTPGHASSNKEFEDALKLKVLGSDVPVQNPRTEREAKAIKAAQAYKPGDTVKFKDDPKGKIHTIETIGDDGYIYMRSGLAAKTADIIEKAEPKPDTGTFGGLVAAPEDRSPSHEENKARWKAEGEAKAKTERELKEQREANGIVTHTRTQSLRFV
jgi:hypothetical protein